MKTTYTDEELQAAIDNAILLFGRENGMSWEQLAPNRLAIARAFLDKLEPDPYAKLKAAHAEGKVIQYNCGNDLKPEWEDLPVPVFSDEPDCYRIKPEPSTFEAHGKTWTRHTPGDAMPCDGETVIYAYGDNVSTKPRKCADWFWEESGDCLIIGGRYADVPISTKPISSTPWTPAVGDVVQLKSGGPKMTISEIIPDEVWCTYFDGKIIQHGFPQACLTLVAE